MHFSATECESPILVMPDVASPDARVIQNVVNVSREVIHSEVVPTRWRCRQTWLLPIHIAYIREFEYGGNLPVDFQETEYRRRSVLELVTTLSNCMHSDLVSAHIFIR
jgi:hypothetical protein